ncbi:hypothetical protein KC19_12G001500 [Ceratodon purpureus]|uniref:30S ribosomal protein S20 n=1 Tax=Ceratodon purpureus TaxID=3225 RepID=A0A8T0G7S4_CERPU|nr:hypothetical protein KC19_12G001500 [Ceratodon purpureus]
MTKCNGVLDPPSRKWISVLPPLSVLLVRPGIYIVLAVHVSGVGCSTSVMGPVTRRPVLVRAAAAAPTKKADQAAKRARQNEKRRMYHKSKKSEISTRMKKVFVALDGLKKRTDLSEDDIKPIESLIAEAFSIIDKAAKVGTLHANKAGHQKSRLSRAKRTLLIQNGLYTPSA